MTSDDPDRSSFVTPHSSLKDMPSKRQTLQEMLVVDVDVHLHEKPAEMAAYIDKIWAENNDIFLEL